MGGEPFFFKLGRMDPDKGWLQAEDALAKLKQDGRRARLVMKGGTAEDHRGHFFGHASWLGLRTAEIHPASGGLAEDYARWIDEAEGDFVCLA